MSPAETSGLLALNQRLLDCIASGDWGVYSELSDPELTAIESEAPGQIVSGLAFHKFYFDLDVLSGPRQTTMCQPVVHVQGDMAVIAYVRLNQKTSADGSPRPLRRRRRASGVGERESGAICISIVPRSGSEPRSLDRNFRRAQHVSAAGRLAERLGFGFGQGLVG
jgi:calcium/calmodulin-dependent protein kinase (CaM kinase) II